MRRRPRRGHGFTLVELLVAIALSTIIVGVVAGITSQAQRAIGMQTLRQDAARAAVAILGDVERDLSGLLPATSAPAPFASTARVLELEAVDGRPALARDRLRMLATLRAPGGTDLVRGFVEYSLGARVVDDAGGPDTGPLTRQVVSFARPGDSTPTAGPAPAILATNVVSFEVEWQRADGLFMAPDAATSTGARFALEGTVNITTDPAGTLLTATTGTALDALPIGAEIGLAQATGPPLRLLVRRRPASGMVLVNDRVPPRTNVAWSQFRGPLALRVTVVVPFGRGPEAGTARFSRTFGVPR